MPEVQPRACTDVGPSADCTAAHWTSPAGIHEVPSSSCDSVGATGVSDTEAIIGRFLLLSAARFYASVAADNAVTVNWHRGPVAQAQSAIVCFNFLQEHGRK